MRYSPIMSDFVPGCSHIEPSVFSSFCYVKFETTMYMYTNSRGCSRNLPFPLFSPLQFLVAFVMLSRNLGQSKKIIQVQFGVRDETIFLFLQEIIQFMHVRKYLCFNQKLLPFLQAVNSIYALDFFFKKNIFVPGLIACCNMQQEFCLMNRKGGYRLKACLQKSI